MFSLRLVLKAKYTEVNHKLTISMAVNIMIFDAVIVMPSLDTNKDPFKIFIRF